jgi:Ankyrin repeat
MQDTDGCTPLHIACRADIGIFLGNLSADVISELVKQRNKEGNI